MEDARIIALYFDRSQTAIEETDRKYKAYLLRVARNILSDRRDAEECINDTYLRAWDAIPPQCPDRLAAFLGKITRRLALDRYDTLTAQKRGGGQIEALLEEGRDCLPHTEANAVADDLALKEALNCFLRALPADRRHLFVRRYWYADSIATIARDRGWTESRVKMQLSRTRQQLREFLEKESIAI